MFTGIVKAVGRIASLERRGGDVRLRITSDDLPWNEFAAGESIAVNGVCLTAVRMGADGFDTDVSKETMRVTTLGSAAAGAPVNLEPALRADERLGGHLVSGHVDCRGTITELAKDARSIRLAVEVPDGYSRYIASKGSICVDGVSLTINAVSGNRFEVNIIPHTAEVTIIGGYVAGSEVNIEVDVVARYLERLLGRDGDDITMEFLRANGYA